VVGVAALGGAGAGDGRRNVVNDNLFKGRERSKDTPESEREGCAGAGAGEEGRLVGRKKGVLSAYMLAAGIW
jgi:hypothetical protein